MTGPEQETEKCDTDEIQDECRTTRYCRGCDLNLNCQAAHFGGCMSDPFLLEDEEEEEYCDE